MANRRNHNLYLSLFTGFPGDLGSVAIEADTGRSWTWGELDELSARMANLLAERGALPGSRVCAHVDKSVEALCLYLACLRAGAVFVPLNPAYQAAELEHFVADATPSVVVCGSSGEPWIAPMCARLGVEAVLTLNANGRGSLMDQASRHSKKRAVAARHRDDLAAILYTSGTTGRSKGAMLTHGNLLSNAAALRDYWGWVPGDVLAHALPIFHIHGLFVAAHGALLNGSKMIWLSKFEPKAALDAIRRATVFMGVPTLYVRLLAEKGLSRESTASMRLFAAGSAPLMAETHREWASRTGHAIVERYGMSETGILTSNPYGPDERFGGQSERRAGTVGFPLPGVELRVADGAGKAMKAGEAGGVQVRGPSVFSGYWRLPEKTREEFTSDGFFKTGDVGMVDGRGYLSIVGRGKDLVISGGFNVYPAEIESYMDAMESVAESALIGAPHPDFGEAGVAIVVAKKGSRLDGDEIIKALKSKLANFKIPKRCVVVEELPRNAMGKVQKNLLREQYKFSFAP